MVQIEISKSKSGYRRLVSWEGINSMTKAGAFANIVWKVTLLNEAGEVVEDPDALQFRKVITPISNTNTVTAEGLLIKREDYQSEEDYEAAKASGFPEFDFWLAAIAAKPLPEVLGQAAQILAGLGRYDK